MLQEHQRNKRKVPDSGYIPMTSGYTRVISHQHTNSLPVDTGPMPMQSNPQQAFSGSINNLADSYHTPSKNFDLQQYHSPNHQHSMIKQEFQSPNRHIKQESFNAQYPAQQHPQAQLQQQMHSSQKVLNKFHNINNHVKTFSLPVDMGPVVPHGTENYQSNLYHMQQPIQDMKDVPMPPGWTSEKTPTGQIYFINHNNQTTTWDDPRRAYIIQTIPLPAGWEECKSVNGEAYYINHNTKSTQWEDPRLEIYIQQENAKRNAYRVPYKENTAFTSSTSSLSSSIGSTSSLSSNQSLNTNSYGASQPLSAKTNQYNNCNNQSQGTTKSNKDIIRNLQQNLDQVLKQKNSVLKQIEDLSKNETQLKSRLSQKDLDEVLFKLKNGNAKMSGFNRYDGKPASAVAGIAAPDMDSTLVVGEANLNPVESKSELFDYNS